MATIRLTDAQRDSFAACGLIVIDGETFVSTAARDMISDNLPGTYTVAPEGWRILTEPCDTCNGWAGQEMCDKGPYVCANPDCVRGRRVVTLTATCDDLGCTKDWRCGCGLGVRHVVDCGRPVPPCPSKCERGTLTLGRFTIPALLPVDDGKFEARPERFA